MKDIIIDFETFATTQNAAVIDLAVIAYDPNPEVVETFEELTQRGLRIKFDLASQRDRRLFSKSTLQWWKEQGPEARKNLAPSEIDVSTSIGLGNFLEYCRKNEVDQWKSQMWCRGMSFDFPILVDLIRDAYRSEGVPENEIDTSKLEPVKFWNQRDIRTAIEAYSLTRGLSMCPLPNGTLNGFVAHDSIHDCAKDILMLKYAQRYALSLEDVPENPDPLSIKNR
ncbi:exonuclease [Enterobacteria phage vB_EcoM_IME341]|uniref:Exonuclease A n=1 Tax=Enterobacteria phage vB_EcoM_IME341 TaxID=2163891 RepID=A0A2S1GS71_9CAUD|nr:exonuclease [Enterobacteria phage vB_EcoM_IME341]AWD92192.1 exonuclease A [Enterobacteria phage vB_EcoM_IME341]QPI13485.1 exonuclease A [Salmonella phage vB_SalM_ABTNLsp5]